MWVSLFSFSKKNEKKIVIFSKTRLFRRKFDALKGLHQFSKGFSAKFQKYQYFQLSYQTFVLAICSFIVCPFNIALSNRLVRLIKRVTQQQNSTPTTNQYNSDTTNGNTIAKIWEFIINLRILAFPYKFLVLKQRKRYFWSKIPIRNWFSWLLAEIWPISAKNFNVKPKTVKNEVRSINFCGKFKNSQFSLPTLQIPQSPATTQQENWQISRFSANSDLSSTREPMSLPLLSAMTRPAGLLASQIDKNSAATSVTHFSVNNFYSLPFPNKKWRIWNSSFLEFSFLSDLFWILSALWRHASWWRRQRLMRSSTNVMRLIRSRVWVSIEKMLKN